MLAIVPKNVLDRLPNLSGLTGGLFNFVFLIYLIIYASANRSASLWTAVFIDISIFAVVIGLRIWRHRMPGTIAGDKAMQEIESLSPLIYWTRRGLASIVVIASVFALVYMSIDLTALILAMNGERRVSTALYEKIAPPASPDIHPALSLELLAGAYIDAHRFEEAEPLELCVLKIRRDLVGERHELIASINGNLGDLYHRWGRDILAEEYYLGALALSKQLQLKQGYGSPLLRLGSLYRQQHRFAESKKILDDAEAIRNKKFGAHSAKVAEVWQEQALLLRDMGEPDKAAQLSQKAAMILHRKAKDDTTIGIIPMLVPLLALLFFTQRNRLLIAFAKWKRNAAQQA